MPQIPTANTYLCKPIDNDVRESEWENANREEDEGEKVTKQISMAFISMTFRFLTQQSFSFRSFLLLVATIFTIHFLCCYFDSRME